MNLTVLPRSVLMPWFRRHKGAAFWFDRLALIMFAIVPSSILMENDLWWSDVYHLFVADLVSGSGYFYKYQTLISSLIAFLAILVAYVVAHYNERKSSYVAVTNIVGLTNGIRGSLKFFSETCDRQYTFEGLEKYNEQILNFADEVKEVVQFINNANYLSDAKMEVMPNVSSFITIMKIFEGKIRGFVFCLHEDSEGVLGMNIEDSNFVKKLYKDLDAQYVALDKYLDKEFCYN